MRFGTRVKDLRERAGLQQIELAQKLGMARSSICRIESGERIVPIKRLAAFAYALNVSLEDLTADLDEYRGMNGKITEESVAQRQNETDPTIGMDKDLMRMLHQLSEDEISSVKQYVQYIINGRRNKN